MAAGATMYSLLLGGYILCFIFFNFVAFCIASFYRKKFNQKSIRAGFLYAIFFLLLVIPCLFIQRDDGAVCRIVRTFSLLAGSIISAWNGIVLFLTMKRVRK